MRPRAGMTILPTLNTGHALVAGARGRVSHASCSMCRSYPERPSAESQARTRRTRSIHGWFGGMASVRLVGFWFARCAKGRSGSGGGGRSRLRVR